MISAVPAILFAIFIVMQGGLIFALGVIALGIVSLHELYTLMRRARPVDVAGFATLVALVLTALYGDRDQLPLVLALAFPLTFALAVARPRRDNVSWGVSATLFGALWIGLAFAHAVLLRELPHGGGLVLDVLAATFLGDTAAYFAGRAFGSRPLAPLISPNKTIEGLLGGIVGGTAAFWFFGLYQDWLSGTDALLMGFLLSLVAPIGDLFESLLKRDLAAKDAGRLFGAHGGALDRLDAVFFTAVAGYYLALVIL